MLLHIRPMLWVDNVKQTIDWYVNSLGFTKTACLETFGYGMKEFAIKDCNGYILQFGQDVPA